jgi:ABC-2 type transport system permease protein
MHPTLLMEWRKLVTTRLPAVVAILTVLVVGGVSVLLALAAHLADGSGPIDLTDPVALRPYYAAAPITGAVFAVVLGALAATAERRHGTWQSTLTADPRRWRVLLAKGATQALAGLLIGVLATAVCILGFAGTLALTGNPTHLGVLTPTDLLACVTAFVLWSVLGVGLGALVDNQAVVVVGVIVLTQLVEPVLRSLGSVVPALETVSSALPGVATEALSGGRIFPSPVADAMGATQGGLVLAAYAAVLVTAGGIALSRREV